MPLKKQLGMIYLKKERIVLMLILIGILVYGFFSEKILVSEGLGFDGAYYGNFTKNFDQQIKDRSINSYYFQRLGIPFILNSVFSAFKIALTNTNVILAYCFTNVLFIFAGTYFF